MKPLKTTRRIRDVANIMTLCAELAVDKEQFMRRFRQFRSLALRYSGPFADIEPYVDQAAKASGRYLERVKENGFSNHIVMGGER